MVYVLRKIRVVIGADSIMDSLLDRSTSFARIIVLVTINLTVERMKEMNHRGSEISSIKNVTAGDYTLT